MLRLVKPEPTTDDDKRRTGDKFDDDEHPERTVVLWQRPHTDRIKPPVGHQNRSLLTHDPEAIRNANVPIGTPSHARRASRRPTVNTITRANSSTEPSSVCRIHGRPVSASTRGRTPPNATHR